MEKLVRSRATVRAAFTRNLGLLNVELEKERPDSTELQIRFAIVREKASILRNEWKDFRGYG